MKGKCLSFLDLDSSQQLILLPFLPSPDHLHLREVQHQLSVLAGIPEIEVTEMDPQDPVEFALKVLGCDGVYVFSPV